MRTNPTLEALIQAQLRVQYPNGETEHHKAYRRSTVNSEGEEGLWFQITRLTKAVPPPEREVKLVEGREWRCDFVWFTQKLVVEIEGGVWTGGRHVRPKGFKEDIKKYEAITKLGYQVHRFTPDMVKRGEVLDFLEDYFKTH